jgi:Tfp pilus assembly protein PilV
LNVGPSIVRTASVRKARLECREPLAFTLLEVMVAMAIFFMAVFGILVLTSQSIGAAAKLDRREIDIGGLAAEFALTNLVEEGSDSGNFGDLYPGAAWTRTVTQVARTPPEQQTLSILLYRPVGGAAGRPGPPGRTGGPRR